MESADGPSLSSRSMCQSPKRRILTERDRVKLTSKFAGFVSDIKAHHRPLLLSSSSFSFSSSSSRKVCASARTRLSFVLFLSVPILVCLSISAIFIVYIKNMSSRNDVKDKARVKRRGEESRRQGREGREKG